MNYSTNMKDAKVGDLLCIPRNLNKYIRGIYVVERIGVTGYPYLRGWYVQELRLDYFNNADAEYTGAFLLVDRE